MTDQRLDTLNKAYFYGDYGIEEYRKLRSVLIDEITQYQGSQEQVPAPSYPTLKIKAPDTPRSSEVSSEKSQRGPSVLQFLWVSIAIILFIYMYTASIE